MGTTYFIQDTRGFVGNAVLFAHATLSFNEMLALGRTTFPTIFAGIRYEVRLER